MLSDKTNRADFDRNTAGNKQLFLKRCAAAQFDLYNLGSNIKYYYTSVSIRKLFYLDFIHRNNSS